MVVKWSGIIGYEGQLTGDGRVIETNALRWEDQPLPLRDVDVDVGAHDGARVVGRILTITRLPDGAIQATGDFDTESPAGYEAARQVYKGQRCGVSMDLDDVSFEIRVAAELLEGLGDGDPGEALEVSLPDPDEEGRVAVATINASDEVMGITDARVRAATLVAIPAFIGATLTLDDPAEFETLSAPSDAPLVASASDSDDLPPRGWFDDPNLPDPTPLTVTPEGRVFGHLALWETCHTAFPGECKTAPRSPSGYAYFRTGSVLTGNGEVAVGTITMDTLHAPKNARAHATISHYENTGAAAAYVAAGEDQHGIWVAGVLAPGLTADDVKRLRASPISGDWRRIGHALELVAALAVNVPGFPIPRPSGMVASGTLTALVASGMVAPRKVIPPGAEGAFSAEDLRYLKRLADAERAKDQQIKDEASSLSLRVIATEVEGLADRVKLALSRTRGDFVSTP